MQNVWYFTVSVFPDKSMRVSKLYKTMREAAGHAESLNRSEPEADHYVMYSYVMYSDPED